MTNNEARLAPIEAEQVREDPPDRAAKAIEAAVADQLPLFDDPALVPPPKTPTQVESPIEDSPEVSENAISLLALADIQGVGFATARVLFDAFGGQLTEVWGAPGDALYEHLNNARIPHPNLVVRHITERPERRLVAARERYVFFTRRRKTSILFRGLPGYPPLLNDLHSPPAWLFVEGNRSILLDPAIVAMVGTRNPSEIGVEAAKRLAVALVRRGCVVLSGLAEGIDEIGHRTAVDFGAPTIAVLGHGIDVVFPAATSGVRRQIIDVGGAVVSEYLPGDSYSRERFVQRNRLQAALSQLVAVVEGQLKSGTAHTMRFGVQLGRPLFGARIGPRSDLPQHELVNELERLGSPVFELDQPAGRDALRDFLAEYFPLDMPSHQTGAPRLFRSLLLEIKRQADDYDATDEDYDWLLRGISKLRRREGSHHAD